MELIRLSNAEIEQHYFNKFIKIYPIPAGSIVFGDRPDVVIAGERTLGIELANFYADPTGEQQKQINIRLACVKKAEEQYLKAGGNLDFHFGFNPLNPIAHVTKVANELCALARKLEQHSVGEVSRDQYEHIPELSYVHRGGEYTDREWRVSQTFTIPYMDMNHLAATIQDKDKKADNYEKCDDLWLLLVIEFIDLAQDQIIPENLPVIACKNFSKVLLYKTGFEIVIDIPTSN